MRFDISKKIIIYLADQLMRFVETVKETINRSTIYAHKLRCWRYLVSSRFLRQVMCAEAVDLVLGSLVRWAQESELTIIITADHGLLEQVFNLMEALASPIRRQRFHLF